jgi:glycosyltransferase involved in cell wall biosynthesis
MSRVLHLITNLGQGGAERQMAYLAGGLVRLGWEVHVGHLEGGPLREQLAHAGVVLHPVPALGSYDPRTPLRLRRLIARVRPDLVQTWIPMMDVIGGLAARSSGTPWVVSERNTPDFFPDGLKFRLRRRLARGAAAVVSNSRSGDRYWAARLPAAVERRVIVNALPLDRMREVAARPDDDFGIPEGLPLVLFAGRLNAQKNIEVLLPAIREVVQRTSAVALLCGIGPLAGQVAAYLREHRLADRVLAPGFVPRLWPWMRRAAVMVSVSRHEGMPNTVMEAAALGCPLVLSAIPQHTDILDASAALYAEVDRPEQVAEAIASVLRDPAAARARAERAAKLASEWSIERASARYAELYQSLLAGSPSR